MCPDVPKGNAFWTLPYDARCDHAEKGKLDNLYRVSWDLECAEADDNQSYFGSLFGCCPRR
jgi:hypothetical protein